VYEPALTDWDVYSSIPPAPPPPVPVPPPPPPPPATCKIATLVKERFATNVPDDKNV
jgi:hypothetical protein